MGRKVKTKGFPKKFGIKLSKVINKSGWYISLILKHIIPTTFDNFRLWIISQTGMENEQDVYNLQSFCKKKGFDKKTMHQFIQHSSRQTTKDNMIFDVPLQNIRKLIEIVLYCEMVGYERERIHILWVLNDSQDASISSSIHNVIENAKDLLDDTDGSPLMEGNMWILLSTANHNNSVTTNHNDEIYAKDIIIKVKKNEKTIKTYEEIMDEFAMSSIKDID